MIKRRISYLTISDIHEFNDLNETQYIAESINKFFDRFMDISQFTKMDIITLAGDIFDYYRDTKHPDLITVLNWIRALMAFCLRHGIKLRILEGTPGHDYKQARQFQPIADAFGPGLDYKYVDVLSIEKMDDLGISVLYVPDEWAGSAAKCQEQVQDLLDRHGLEKVDIAFMHGMFDLQLPDVGEHPLKHNSDWYLSKVARYINIGHDHTFQTYGRILIQGSFDRIAHGEEGKKGAIVCHLDPNGEDKFEFIENKNARIFKTIKITTKDIDQGISQIKKILEKLPDNAHVRISTNPSNPILGVLDNFKMSYPSMKFKKHTDKKQLEDTGDKLNQVVSLGSAYVPITINEDNIIDSILSRIDGILSDPMDAILLRAELEAIIHK